MSIAKANEMKVFDPSGLGIDGKTTSALLQALAPEAPLVASYPRWSGTKDNRHLHFLYLRRFQQDFATIDLPGLFTRYQKSKNGSDATVSVGQGKEVVTFSEILKPLFATLKLDPKDIFGQQFGLGIVEGLFQDIERNDSGKIVQETKPFRDEASQRLYDFNTHSGLIKTIKNLFFELHSPGKTKNPDPFNQKIQTKPAVTTTGSFNLHQYAESLAREILWSFTPKIENPDFHNAKFILSRVSSELEEGLFQNSPEYCDRIRFYLPKTGESLKKTFTRQKDQTLFPIPPSYQVLKSSLSSLTLAAVPERFQPYFPEIQRIGKVLEAINPKYASQEHLEETMRELSPSWMRDMF